MEDHIHLLISLHPTIALSDFIKTIKVASNYWMKKRPGFPNFKDWSVGYAAFTCSYRNQHHLIDYIKNQQEHHKKESFKDEIRRIFREEGLDFDERFFDN